MAKFFTFADRFCKLQFFEEDPIVVTLFLGDETDKRIMDSGALIEKADKQKDLEQRTKLYRQALELLIGEEKTEAILARADTADSFSILAVWNYILQVIREQKVKNLVASGR